MANPVVWALNQVKRLNDAIWHTSLSELSKRKSFLIKQLRIIVLAARGFASDNVQLRASALTLYTILSIVPIIAIGFAIAKGFGLDQNLENMITNKFQAYPEFLTYIISLARNALQDTKGGYIAGVGVIILFWSVMSLLNRVESSLNHIWQISSARSWYRKFTDYLTLMLIAPVFVILSGSITVFISTKLPEYISHAPILSFFKPVISFLIKFSPYILIWIVLTFIFIVIPNAKVKFLPALVSGIIAGTVLQLLQWFYLDLQFGIYKLNAIYGGFAMIPLFIIFIQTSWIVVLLGAELTFANQNISRYELESEAHNISAFHKRALILMIMNMIIKNFAAGEKPVSTENIAKVLKIPVRLANDILQDLADSELVSVIHEKEQKERLYQPALDINRLSVSFVLSRLDKRGIVQRIIIKNKEYDRVIQMLEKFEKMIAKSEHNVLIKNL